MHSVPVSVPFTLRLPLPLALATAVVLLLNACAYGLDTSAPDSDESGERDDVAPSAPAGGTKTLPSKDGGRSEAGSTAMPMTRDAAVDAVDANPQDALVRDVSAEDVDAPDGKGRDAGSRDASVPDSSLADAHVPDTSARDTGTPVFVGAAACVLISEYLDASSNERAIELWNRCTTPVSLGRLRLCLETNSHTDCHEDTALSGTLGANAVVVVCHPNFRSGPCDFTNDAVDYNGDDRIALFFDANGNGSIERTSDVLVDSFGRLGFSPPSGVVPAVNQPWEDVDWQRTSCSAFTGGTNFDATRHYARASSNDRSHLGVAPSLACP